VRRERLDHVLILGAAHLRRGRREYAASFNAAWPHQGINQAIPASPRDTRRRSAGPMRAIPIVGGLHHDYRQAA
jgi:hypothetical protein